MVQRATEEIYTHTWYRERQGRYTHTWYRENDKGDILLKAERK